MTQSCTGFGMLLQLGRRGSLPTTRRGRVSGLYSRIPIYSFDVLKEFTLICRTRCSGHSTRTLLTSFTSFTEFAAHQLRDVEKKDPYAPGMLQLHVCEAIVCLGKLNRKMAARAHACFCWTFSLAHA